MCLNKDVKCPVDSCLDCRFNFPEYYRYFETKTTERK